MRMSGVGVPVRDGASRGTLRAAAMRRDAPRLAKRSGWGAQHDPGESFWDGERACAWGETERVGVGQAGSETGRADGGSF